MNPPRRPPSSASVRSGQSSSSPFVRPSSSTSSRPPSSASAIRPSSSASSVRPSSSAGSVRHLAPSRAESRATHRPSSRFARPATRQSTRLNPLYQTLITQLTGWTAETNEDDFLSALDLVVRKLDQTTRPAGSADFATIDKQIRGSDFVCEHVEKARINMNDGLAEALQHVHQRLKSQSEMQNDLDADIQASRIPSHVQFLLALSRAPTSVTLDAADDYMDLVRNPEKAKTGLSWKDILAEEPFEGQHWEGAYGLPRGSVVGQDDASSSGSSPSLSPWEDDLDDLEEQSSQWGSYSTPDSPLPSPPTEHANLDVFTEEFSEQLIRYSHRDEIESIQARQYWRNDWRGGIPMERPFNIGDPSTLNQAYHRATARGPLLQKPKYIYELYAVREVLMGLQGRRNLLFEWKANSATSTGFSLVPDMPELQHLTPAAQRSVISLFASRATTLEHLRRFVAAMFKSACSQDPLTASVSGSTQYLSYLSRRSTRTFEAFSEAVDKLVRDFDLWCATREEEICAAFSGTRPPLIISLMSLDKATRDQFSATFDVLLDLVREVVRRATQSNNAATSIWNYSDLPKRIPPAAITTVLLDSLMQKIQDYSSMGDVITSQSLLRVFGDTAEPLWVMVHRWLKDGMPLIDVNPANAAHGQHQGRVSEEFFIEDNELVLLDPDFWQEGFVLRDSDVDYGRASSVPMFLQDVAPHVLAAGKAVGLLHALGMSIAQEQSGNRKWLCQWRPLGELLESAGKERAGGTAASGSATAFKTSEDDFSRLVYDELIGICTEAKQTLMQVLVDECDLWQHLTSIEELYLMQRGDIMSDFLNLLFSRMDSLQMWNDFHSLNTAFSDLVSTSKWIDPALVRLSYRGHRNRTFRRTVQSIEGLFIEYAVPFPLTYIFGPRALQSYSALFVYIMQIRRAKNALERIVIRSALADLPRDTAELKMFYAMRGKLSWFVNMLLNFVCTNVVHMNVQTLHETLRKASSLDEMMALHEKHIAKLQEQCLLTEDNESLHRAILSILDMALHFSDHFLALAGDSAHDIARQAVKPIKAHRSKRLRRQRRNVIGFTHEMRAVQDSSEDSDSDAEERALGVIEHSFSLVAEDSLVDGEEDIGIRLDRMSGELNTLVRFIRRGAEGLASGANETASVFDVLAFALGDWDQ